MRHADHYLNDAKSCYTSKPWDDNPVEQELKQIYHAFAWCQASSPERTIAFALYMNDFLRTRGRTAILRKWLKSALDVAEVTGNEHSKANVLQSLGDLELRLDNMDAARQHLEKALKLFGVASYQLGKAILLMSLGDLELSLDDVDLARQHFEDALPLYEAVCSRLGKVNVHMSDFELGLGSVDAARQYVQNVLQQIQSPGDLELGDLESRVDNFAV